MFENMIPELSSKLICMVIRKSSDFFRAFSFSAGSQNLKQEATVFSKETACKGILQFEIEVYLWYNIYTKEVLLWIIIIRVIIHTVVSTILSSVQNIERKFL